MGPDSASKSGLKIERARGPEACKMAVGPAKLSSGGPNGPATILLGTYEFFNRAYLTYHTIDI